MTLENQAPVHKFLFQNILNHKKPQGFFFPPSKCRVYKQNFQEKKGHKFLHDNIYENVSGFFFFFKSNESRVSGDKRSANIARFMHFN